MSNELTIDQVVFNLSKVSNGKSAKLFSFFSISEDECERIYPLSAVQYGIFLDASIEGWHVYNNAMIEEFSGVLNPLVWEAAIDFVVRREPTLRTILVKKDDLPYQAVMKEIEIEFSFFDVGAASYSREQALEFISEQVYIPYSDVFSAPCCRHIVVKTGEKEFYLVLASNQIMHDAVSAMNFFSKVRLVYDELLSGHDCTDLDSYPYEKYVFHNREVFNKPEAVEYWTGVSENCDILKFDLFASAAVGRSEIRSLTLDAATVKMLRGFCRCCGITVPVYLKILFGILLRFYSKPSGDFILFENVHGRSAESMDAMGLFFHPVPMLFPSTMLNAGNSFADLVSVFKKNRRLQEQYNEVTMEMLHFGEKRDSLVPVFNFVRLIEQNSRQGRKRFSIVETKGAVNDVQLFALEVEDAVELKFFYNSSVFNGDAFLERMQFVSGQICNKPEINLADLNYVTPEEMDHMSKFFTQNGLLVDQHCGYFTLFERTARAHFYRMAVCSDAVEMTYGEVLSSVNILSDYLFSRGITKGNFVAVWMERSELTLIGLLSILKVGAIYVPIDSSLPDEQVGYILENANPALLITTSHFVRRLSRPVKNLFLADIQLRSLKVQAQAPLFDVSSEDIAYMIYTSGTTGRPKGALVEHLGMLNHLASKLSLLGLDEQSVVAQTARVSFDISLWQMLAPLLVGGKVIVYPDDVVTQVEDFLNSLYRDRVTVLEVVPSYLQMILSLSNSDLINNAASVLQKLIVTGDKFPVHLAKKWIEAYPAVTLINAYGPTEASDDITHHVINDISNELAVPVGKPIPNSIIYVVDGFGKLCPPGVKGEIWAGGICVGRGYLNNEEQTARAFVANPFEVGGKGMVYKTGDIGAWRSDGNLMFYGRIDSQIKIRGHRVELTEIEHVLNGISEGCESVVLALPDSAQNETKLVAYVRGFAGGLKDIRFYLAERLPFYMIPAGIVMMENWPLNLNGKVDRSQLAAMEPLSGTAGFEEPVTVVQSALAGIWKEVLGKEQVGLGDDFFELGGHSLKAMQLVSRIQEKFALKLDLKTIFKNATLGQMAEQISSRLLVNSDIQDAQSQHTIII